VAAQLPPLHSKKLRIPYHRLYGRTQDRADKPEVTEMYYWEPQKTLIAVGRLNFSYLRLKITLTARQAACVFCKPNLSEIHLVGRRVRL
jgi:hypothetical protein